MAFNPKLCSIPIVTESDNIGMPDLPIVFPYNALIKQTFMGSSCNGITTFQKGGVHTSTPYTPSITDITLTLTADVRQYLFTIGSSYLTRKFIVEPSVYDRTSWCRISAWDSQRFNYSSFPIYVYFKAFQRKIEQQNVVVKYDDEVGTVIPLSQKQFDVLTFTTQPMNSDYARLLLDIAEWDNVTFGYWNKENNAWSTALNVAKKAEAWNRMTYPRTLGTTIQGSFVIKQ